MKNHRVAPALPVFMAAVVLGVPALAQQTPDHVETGASTSAAPANGSQSNMNPSDNSTYATGQPLQTKSNEGFWGHMNPFARKKWVNRQLEPVKGRLNELDQLSAKNARDIQDVDGRAQAGIRNAQSTADQANQVATDAGSKATQAQLLAQQASSRTDKLNTTVASLDQYQSVTETEIRFKNGQTVLNAKAKKALDDLADQLNGKQGYVVEVQGFSRTSGQAGIQSSQKMANAVVRYLVTEHNVPMYRVHQLALGNAKLEGDQAAHGTAVHVTLLQNSLATLNQPTSDAGSTIGAAQQYSAQPSPQGAASQPSGAQVAARP